MGTFVRSIEREELLCALRLVVGGLLYDTNGVEKLAGQVEQQLHELVAEWDADCPKR
jgi:hypothetical protein